jgi:predicted  nucleic acid-binding Zn-ribbon protein
MQPVIEKLLVLQDRDRSLLRLNAELANVPIQRGIWEKRSADAQAAFEQVKSKSFHLESDRKKLELEVETLQQRLQKVQGEQNSTRSNDQYKAYQHQIETIETEVRRKEDEELDLMEKFESLSHEVKSAAVVMAKHKEETARNLSELQALEENLKKKIAALQLDRASLTTGIEEPILAKYERLLKTKGENAVVGVDRSVCGGCHMKLPTQNFVLAKGAQQLVTCPNCARILYYTSDMHSGSED